MQSPQLKLKQIQRILALWPSQAADDPDEFLRAYLLAVEDYPAWDVETAVDAFIKGTAPGVNPSFRPKPSEVGAECRRQNNLRCTAEARDKALHPALPKPDLDKSPESRARFKAVVETIVANLAMPPEDDPIERHRRIVAHANDRFDAERGFEVGDPEGAADAA